MKKLLCAALIALMVLTQLMQAFAETQNVTVLQFNDIERKILDYSQEIRDNNSINGNVVALDNSLDTLNGLKTSIDMSVNNMRGKLTDPGLSSTEKDIYQNMIDLYNTFSGQVLGQINSVQSQIKNSWMGTLRTTTANDAVISSAQNLFLLYSSLQLQKEEMNVKAEQVNVQVNIAKLQKDLGIISESAFEDLSIQVQETDDAIKALDENMEDVKGQINLMLGQGFDSPITMGALPIIDDGTLEKMNYNTDIETGRKQNIDIRLLESSDTYKIDNQTRKYKFTFDQKYRAVFNSKKTLDNETAKLGREEKKQKAAQLKYDAGLISKVDLEKQDYAYKSQLIKVKTAQKDLLQAYTSYQWLLRGYETR